MPEVDSRLKKGLHGQVFPNWGRGRGWRRRRNGFRSNGCGRGWRRRRNGFRSNGCGRGWGRRRNGFRSNGCGRGWGRLEYFRRRFFRFRFFREALGLYHSKCQSFLPADLTGYVRESAAWGRRDTQNLCRKNPLFDAWAEAEIRQIDAGGSIT